MEISKKLKYLIEHYELTEEELARIVGVTADTIFDYESGIKVPDEITLKKLANALFTTAAFLADKNKQLVSLTIEKADGSYQTAIYEEPEANEDGLEKYTESLNDLIEKEKIKNNNFAGHPEKDYIRAHKYCTNNKEALENSSICGCFFCLSIYSPNEIIEWLPNESTALCPHCGIDSVIPENSGYKIDKFSLKTMHDFWFGTHISKK